MRKRQRRALYQPGATPQVAKPTTEAEGRRHDLYHPGSAFAVVVASRYPKASALGLSVCTDIKGALEGAEKGTKLDAPANRLLGGGPINDVCQFLDT
jgi:hypothetical protein